jgi:glutathione S-transferase
LYFRPESMGTMVAGGEPLDPAGTDAAIALVRQVWKGKQITAVQLADDLQALPGLLDHVDALMAGGVLGGESPTAADLLIGSTLDVLRMVGDVRDLIEARPCARLATDWFEERPGRIPAGAFPAGWVPQPA